MNYINKIKTALISLSSSSSSSSDKSIPESNYDMGRNGSDAKNFAGDLLNNKYLLIYQIGKGTFAKVWLSLNIHNQTYYAIKMQNFDSYDYGLEEVTFLKMLNTCDCPYICQLLDHFEHKHNDEIYICMVFELMAGSIYDIMKVGKYSTGLPFNTVKIIIYQLLVAMSIINNKYNIIHTDIKPENILLCGMNNKVIQIIDKFKKCKHIPFSKKHKLNKNQIKKNMDNIKFDEIEKKYEKCEENNNIDFIEKGYVQDINIKLADFGSCIRFGENEYNIQTRYYRAPEIILHYDLTYLCDMWSVGCIIYELLVGETLFNPDKKKRFGRDRCHIYEMHRILGNIPQNLLLKSKNYSHYYKKNGLLKRVGAIDYKPLHILLTEKLINKSDITQEQLTLTIDLIYKLLMYDPHKRPSPKLALSHKWFSDIKK